MNNPAIFLKITDGLHAGANFQSESSEVTIGSSVHCDITLLDEGVQSEHALIRSRQGRLECVMLGEATASRSDVPSLTDGSQASVVTLACRETVKVGAAQIQVSSNVVDAPKRGHAACARTFPLSAPSRNALDAIRTTVAQRKVLSAGALVGSVLTLSLVWAAFSPTTIQAVPSRPSEIPFETVSNQVQVKRYPSPINTREELVSLARRLNLRHVHFDSVDGSGLSISGFVGEARNKNHLLELIEKDFPDVEIFDTSGIMTTENLVSDITEKLDNEEGLGVIDVESVDDSTIKIAGIVSPRARQRWEELLRALEGGMPSGVSIVNRVRSVREIVGATDFKLINEYDRKFVIIDGAHRVFPGGEIGNGYFLNSVEGGRITIEKEGVIFNFEV